MKRTLIIAEAGVNHNGSLELAKQLIEKAAEARVDYVKFQTFKADKLVTKSAPKADYQVQNTAKQENNQLQMLQKLELSHQDHLELMAYCDQCGIRFLSTAFDLDSMDFLHSLHLGLWKIPSGEITNYPYLKKVGGYAEEVILSTGMSTMEEIADALQVLTDTGLSKEQITLLQCNTEYPTPYADVNLRAIRTMADVFGVKVGYSDHTRGTEVSLAAVALGAAVIEKHFTLDRNLPGPDHKASLEPQELKEMVDSIRHIELALGSDIKQVSPSEDKNRAIARKSIVAACEIRQGETFTEDNLTVKRPGNGISPMRWGEVIGQMAARDFKEDELIEI